MERRRGSRRARSRGLNGNTYIYHTIIFTRPINEPGIPLSTSGGIHRRPARGHGAAAERRQGARVPRGAGGDDVRRDREGDGAPAAGGEHRDAGSPAAEVGREARHQEGGEGSAGPRVPAGGAVPRDWRRGCEGGAPGDRAGPRDHPAPQAARGSDVSVRTPSGPAARTTSARPMNRPFSITPGTLLISRSSLSGFGIGRSTTCRA